MNEVHDHIQALIAAYAIGAVPDDEVPAIRSHILSCGACFAEVESYTEALSLLPACVDPVPLPKGFIQRVMQAARGESAVKESQPRAGRRWWRTLVPAVAAVATVSLLGMTVALVHSMDRQREYRAAVTSLIGDRDALSLEGPGGAQAAVASTDEGLVLVTVDLGEAPRDRDYQLWLMRDGVPTPAVTFDVGESLVVVESPEDFPSYDGAAITVEPDGGSRQPTTEPVLTS